MIRRLFALALVLAPAAACASAAAPADAGIDAPVSAPASGEIGLLNRTQAVRAMDSRYDPLLRDAGVTGTVDADVTLNADGTVRASRIVESTHGRFSDSARQVAQGLRFSPPAVPGTAVRVRMQFIYGRGSIRVLGVVTGAPAAP